MRLAITGHRPERIPSRIVAVDSLFSAYAKLNPSVVIQGMSAGVDLWSARVAWNRNIPFWSVKPWAGHEPREEDSTDYKSAWRFAEKRIVVNPSQEYIGPWLYQRRNEWMVNHADGLLAVWDGVEKGGTWNCVKYAKSIKDVPIWRIDPVTGKFSKYA